MATKKATTTATVNEASTVFETAKTSREQLEAIIGKPLGNPVYGLAANCKPFPVEMTGKLQLKSFTDNEGKTVKSFYYGTKQHLLIKVNGAYDQNLYAEGTIHQITVREAEVNDERTETGKRMVKFCVFATPEEIAAAKAR